MTSPTRARRRRGPPNRKRPRSGRKISRSPRPRPAIRARTKTRIKIRTRTRIRTRISTTTRTRTSENPGRYASLRQSGDSAPLHGSRDRSRAAAGRHDPPASVDSRNHALARPPRGQPAYHRHGRGPDRAGHHRNGRARGRPGDHRGAGDGMGHRDDAARRLVVDVMTDAATRASWRLTLILAGITLAVLSLTGLVLVILASLAGSCA